MNFRNNFNTVLYQFLVTGTSAYTPFYFTFTVPLKEHIKVNQLEDTGVSHGVVAQP